ncbi:MAG: methyl-accepting chemotaxis protein [Aquabacterium sp.]|uniref:methyl-accepting chemotaxis protein n=1 Tax=Aquabacterium sp. TaxID=1872578 RepID=UPI003BB21D38
MLLFSRSSIRARLATLSGLVVIALAIVCLAGATSVKQLSNQFDTFRTGEFEQLAHLVQLRQGMGDIRRYEKDVLLNIDNVDEAKRYQDKWKVSVKATKSDLQRLQELSAPGATSEILDLMGRYEVHAGEVLQKTINGQIVMASEGNEQMAPAKALMHKADPLVEALASQLQQQATARAHDVSAVASSRLVLLLAVAGACLAIFIPAIWFVIRSISRPLMDAVAIADQVAAGDLAHRIDTSGDGELGALLRSLAKMQASLRDVVAGVKSAGDAILGASSEVAQGSLHLSQRTERAAAELQRTASTMQELSVIVAQSRTEAEKVADLGLASLQATQRGGAIVQDVVTNMSKVKACSEQISEMIGVVDAIAFQTNLLALNAAVEAARAGEQGRGFAVVAAEVRQLSQRSAMAAKDIASVIKGAVAQVEHGSKLVGAARAEMDEVLTGAHQVAAMMKGLNARSTEQAQDVQEVAAGIGELDAWTQENAALVEQSSAAADALKQQAVTLNEMMGRFRLAA